MSRAYRWGLLLVSLVAACGGEQAGPTGAALRAVIGGWGAAPLVAGLMAWTAVPLALAARMFRGRDL